MCNFRKLIYKIIGENPADCVLSSWSAWTTCSGGFKSRTRTIITPASEGGAACGPLTETVSCGEAFKWIGSTPYCEQTTTTNYYFKGIYAQDDPAHPNGGVVKYINNIDVEVTENIFIEDGCMEFTAKNILSTTGVITCTI